MGTQGWPSRFVGESGDVLVGLVEPCDGVGSEELFGRDVEAVGVALDRLEKPGPWVVEVAKHGARGAGRFIAGEDLLQHLGRRARCDGVGSDEGVRVAVADDLEVEVVGCPAASEHGVQLLPGLLPGSKPVHGVGGDALGGVDGGGVAEARRSIDVVGGESDRVVAAVCRTVRPPFFLTSVMVQRSPFLTQSVPVRRSRRSLARVMITSPTLA